MGPQQRCYLAVNIQAVEIWKLMNSENCGFNSSTLSDVDKNPWFILVYLDLILIVKLQQKANFSWKSCGSSINKALTVEAFCPIERSSHSWNVCVEDHLALVFKLTNPQSQSNIHNSQHIYMYMSIVYDRYIAIGCWMEQIWIWSITNIPDFKTLTMYPGRSEDGFRNRCCTEGHGCWGFPDSSHPWSCGSSHDSPPWGRWLRSSRP